MEMGFPVETPSNGGKQATAWSDQLPQVATGIFGGRAFYVSSKPQHVLMGLACVQCGFVELYKLSQEDMLRFLQNQSNQKKESEFS